LYPVCTSSGCSCLYLDMATSSKSWASSCRMVRRCSFSSS
jgi:hypothetical protein